MAKKSKPKSKKAVRKAKPAKAKAKKAKAKKGKAKQVKSKKVKAKTKKIATKTKATAKKKVAKKAKKKVAKKAVKKAVKKVTKKAAPKKKVAKKVVKKALKKASKPTIFKKVRAVSKPVAKVVAKPTPAKEVVTVKVPVAVTETTAPSTNHVFVPHSTSLKAGMMAPFFEGVDQNGHLVKSSDLLGKTVLLYFYPKDDTPGCTAESCSLRDEYQYLNSNNYAVIGVSADDVESHKKFADKYSLPFPLIADTNHAIIKAYDVWGTKQLAGNIYDGIVRTTFVIDADGIIKNVVTKVDTANHAKQLMEL